MFNYMERFISPNNPARGQLFFNSVTLYAYDAADVIDDVNYDTVLDSYVTTSSLQGANLCTEKELGLDHLVLAIRWGILPKKALNTIRWLTACYSHSVAPVFIKTV